MKALKVPYHVAIIMDGNGRWAKKKGLPRIFGHKAGAEAVRDIIKTSRDIGVKYLTLYVFSKENWKRPYEEVKNLMYLIKIILKREIEDLNKNNVRLKVIGDVEDLPHDVQEIIKYAIDRTKNNGGLVLTLAISYGGRAEIIKAIKKILMDFEKGNLHFEDIDEEFFRNYLYDPELPDPDLIIRTSGELRISNFLLWQSAYSEFYFTKTLWPDFRRNEFLKAIEDYSKRVRKFGTI